MARPGPRRSLYHHLSLSALGPQGIRARDQLHRHLEEAIAEKLQEDKAVEPGDALDLIIHSARELGQEPSVQELKVSGAWPFFPSLISLAGF